MLDRYPKQNDSFEQHCSRSSNAISGFKRYIQEYPDSGCTNEVWRMELVHYGHNCSVNFDDQGRTSKTRYCVIAESVRNIYRFYYHFYRNIPIRIKILY